MAKTYATRPSVALWGSIRITAWIFILVSALLTAAYAYRVILLQQLDPMEPMRDFDPVPGNDLEGLFIGILSLPYFVSYLVGAVLTLRWYLRSIRNAHVLHRGITASPGWVIWYFIVPIVSLYRPYTMTSELWCSSHRPEGWKSQADPPMLRWWWGLVLVSGFISIVASAIAISADTASALVICDGLTALSLLLAGVSGILFLRIGGPISRNQTALIEASHRPADSTVPAWSA